MLESLIMAFILISGSFLSAVKFNRKFEETLPITCMTIVCILFLFGLMNCLKYGVFMILVTVMTAYLYSFWLLIRGGLSLCRTFSQLFFTPAFLIFLFFFIFFHWCDFGLLATGWDEFSCWIDHVKIMSYLDDFMTNPASGAYFVSYPPGMELFLYFFQKIRFLFNPGGSFSEWRVFLVRQIFSISIFFPFLKQLSFKRPVPIIVSTLLLMIIPLPFYNDFLTSLYIDSFVAPLAGCGFAAILLFDGKDPLCHIYISLICVMLVLSKDVGLFFACFLAIAWFLSQNANDYRLHKGEPLKSKFYSSLINLIPAICTIAAKLLWKLELYTSGSYISFGGKIDLIHYTSMFLFHNDTTYKQEVVDNFKDALYTYTVTIGMSNSVTYFTLLCIFLLLFFFTGKALISCQAERTATVKITLWTAAACLLLYIYCLGATYASNLSEYEATNLASFHRYINIGFLACWFVLIMSGQFLINRFVSPEKQTMFILSLAILVIAVSPMKSLSDFSDRGAVRDSIEKRYYYNEMGELIQTNCDEDDRIYFISQANNGYDFYVTRFVVRPKQLDCPAGWSLGEPFYEGDIWTRLISSEDWQQELLDHFEFVALYNVNDAFIEMYGGLFADSAQISNNTLFRINQETGLLERCA